MNNNLPHQDQPIKLINRFDLKTLILVMMVILLATVIVLWNPDMHTRYQQDRQSTLTAQAGTSLKPDAKLSPYPPDILDYPDQTNPIILGSVIIMLVIVGGTLGVIQHRK